MTDAYVSQTYLRGFAYRTCKPNEYLIKTGFGVHNETVGKKTYQLPFQRVTCISMSPRNYEFVLGCISKDMVPFELPVVFTCGPYDHEEDRDGFKRYAQRMSTMTNEEIKRTVNGVIHGQTRLYAAGMTVMEMFSDRDAFKIKVQERIEKELRAFGLKVFNGNIAEMRDKAGNNYFESLKQKAISGATNAARVATASANKVGDVGEWEKRIETDVEKKSLEVRRAENNNKQDEAIQRSNLELQKVKIQCDQELRMRQVEADMVPKQKQIQNDTALEKLGAIRQQESLRANDLARSVVKAEQLVKQAEGEALAKQRTAEASRYAEQQKAEAKFFAAKKEAEAELYNQQKQAEGITAIANARAAALKQLAESASPELVKFYLGIESGYFTAMADKSASAIQGLQPKINVWTTGGETGKDGQVFAPLRNLFASIPPMADALETQAGVKMPNWMPHKSSEQANGDFVQVPKGTAIKA